MTLAAAERRTKPTSNHEYPTWSKYPMPETEHHRNVMFTTIQTLEDHFELDPTGYASGDLLIFYERGNKRRHVSPDVFFVRGVRKYERLNYLVWEEGEPPHVVIEITSRTTRRSDMGRKRDLYRDVLRVREYFQFDPYGDYLDPPLQGERLVRGQYRPIEAVAGRLPSREMGLDLVQVDVDLRLFDPRTGQILLTRKEAVEEARAKLRRVEQERDRLEAEVERLRRGGR